MYNVLSALFRLFVFCGLLGSHIPAFANQLPDGVEVSFQLNKSYIDSGDEVGVVFNYSNSLETPVRLLKWGTALEGRLNEDLLAIYYEQRKLPYTGRIYKRGIPQATDYVLIQPKTSISATVNIRDAYPVNQRGDYRIQLGASLQSELSGQSMAKPSSQILTLGRELSQRKQTPEYNSCSVSQQAEISTALDAAELISKTARDDLAGTPVNQRANAQRYTEWFGSYSLSNWNSVQENFNSIYTATASEVLGFDCTCTDGYFAYVYPNDEYNIYLCNAFWSAPSTGTDSKSGTIVHELSHFTVVADTNDEVYGQEGARNLAASSPSVAITNADSHEYFAENTPFISMPDSVSPPPTPTPSDNEGDLLLDIVPILAAVATNTTPQTPNSALTQVKKFSGRWKGLRTSSGYEFNEYFRFLASTAFVVGNDAGISGESHIDGAFDYKLNNTSGIYLSNPSGWAIFDPWGLPTSDLGSMYVFTTLGANVSASHFYYYPSTLELSSGVATPTAFTKLSSSWKAKESSTLTEQQLLDLKLATYREENARASKMKGLQSSKDVTIAERALEIKRQH
ncbi:M35 family metallo-endopeptidase [Arenicella xantha]|uniref:Lysine-specific metallo-endopeptidase family protein n=1 Tax=Arenicella xantha TaxID=644221 RepID=A0A395JLY0_9GAMM|nr:M35 family metallo-endopeptidase [Arenicella xantha]RBP51772.1 lysine-specific metallo-endopeptidase family protein [Arenicella xantha]